MRGCDGERNNSRGGPSSTMRPWSMKTTRSATSSANCISCVTISIVMPSRARSRMTSAPRRSARDRAPRSPRRTASASAAWRANGRWRHVAAGRRTALRDSRPPCCARPTLRSNSARRGSPPRRLRFSTRVGPSMTFSSAVRCGNRLKRWNTMPIPVRICRDLRSDISRQRRRPAFRRSVRPRSLHVPRSAARDGRRSAAASSCRSRSVR